MTREEAIENAKLICMSDKDRRALAITKVPISLELIKDENGISIFDSQVENWCFCLDMNTFATKPKKYGYFTCFDSLSSQVGYSTTPPDESLFEWIDDEIEAVQDEMGSFGGETFAYYHVTSKSNVASILEKGLVAQKGKHSELVKEMRDNVYLCSKKDIPHWICELGMCDDYAILEIQLDSRLKPIRYSNYTEYMTEEIPPGQIREFSLDLDLTEAKVAIANRLIDALSRYCYYALLFWAEETEESEKNDILECLRFTSLEVLQLAFHTIDWESVCTDTFVQALQTINDDGSFPFTDVVTPDTSFSNRDENLRIWQLLERYPKHTLVEETEFVLSVLRKLPEEVLFAKTGGWD